jgi:polysaccharide export outer membrane protein
VNGEILTVAKGFGRVAALLVLAAQSAAFAQEAAPARAATQGAAQAGYQVQPGDLLHISVWREEGLNQDVLVRPDGAFSFPLAGDVSAIGQTVEDLRLEISQRLSRYIPELVVTVTVKEIKGNKVYVFGQVNRPGEFIVNPRVDVMQALSMAGGTTPFAKLDEIFVLRRSRGEEQERLMFRFSDVARGRQLEQNVLLQSGDVVVVP